MQARLVIGRMRGPSGDVYRHRAEAPPNMALELDHVFIACALNAPEGDALAQLGLVEGSGNTHPGQGTANRRYFFANFMLELLWVANGDEATGNAQNQRTRLYERWSRRSSGACPFGVVFRRTGDSPSPAPFRTWSYRPSYLPENLSIEIAVGTTLEEPELLYLPFVRSPGPRHGEPIDHRVPIRNIRGISIGVPPGAKLSEGSKSARRCGLLNYHESDSHVLEIHFEALKESLFDIRPTLPLLFRGVAGTACSASSE